MSEDGAPCDPYAHYAAEFVRTGLLGFLGPVGATIYKCNVTVCNTKVLHYPKVTFCDARH